MPHIIVGTAGHIDHGKTALVKALTGIDTDRLKEEKERGITIDLGFANLPVDDHTTIGFVDVPGHERFIKNMLAGVGGIDAVLLVIAADESVMPQTREHLAICSLLRVAKGLTVITKIDAVDADLADLVEIEVQEFVKGTFLEAAPTLRVSARSGQGLPDLVAALRQLAAAAQPRDESRIFRLPVDRCFTMKGFGAVAAGTLIAGSVRKDDEVELLPHKTRARVRSVQVHGHTVDQAHAGQRTALNLQRVDLSEIERGMVITVPGVFSPSVTFDVEIELLENASSPISARKRIRFHTGTSELIGYVVLLGQDRLSPGEKAFARIRLEKPLFAAPGDRFIVRQYSPMTTIGGGEILDAHPPKLRRSDPAIVDRLRALRDRSVADRILQFVNEAGGTAITEANLVSRLALASHLVRTELRALAERGSIRTLSDEPLIVVAAAVMDEAERLTALEVRRHHAAEPLLKGIGREDLRARVFGSASPLLFKAVIDRLTAARVLDVDQDLVHQYGRRVMLQGDDQQLRERLAGRFRELGLQAPPPDEVAAGLEVERVTARKIIQLLVREQTLVKINDTMIVDRHALQRLIDDLRARKAQHPRLGVGDFKALTGLSRKFAVPLLEYLDSQKVTRRVGDERVIL